ncbi:MAG: hypothetical protein Q4C50_13000 [Eubacteriales bacterium]|nr:hypothetical protein [Eubacteriales bacterium]
MHEIWTKYSGLEKLVNKSTIEELKTMKKSALSNEIIFGMETSKKMRVVNEDETGIAFWLMDQLYRKENELYIKDADQYKGMLRILEKFDEIGRILW